MAINGFGRIGRSVARVLLGRPGAVQLVAINDHGTAADLRDALAHDSVYGTLSVPVTLYGSRLHVGGRTIQALRVQDPARLPWKKLKVDVVVESTGAFTKVQLARRHLRAGAGRVLMSAFPDGPAGYVLAGACSLGKKKAAVLSHASCTTSAVAPLLEALRRPLGVDSAVLFGVQSVTHSQNVVDKTTGDGRRRRSVLGNIIPVDVDANLALPGVLPRWRGHFAGQGVRVPTPIVHLAVLTLAVRRATTVNAVNAKLKELARSPKLSGIVAVTDQPVVSQDFRATSVAATVDLGMTMVAGRQVQIAAWYDNEWAFATRLAEVLETLARDAQSAHGHR